MGNLRFSVSCHKTRSPRRLGMPFVTVIWDPSSRIYSMFCKSRSRRFSQNVGSFAEKFKIQLPKFYPWRGFGSRIYTAIEKSANPYNLAKIDVKFCGVSSPEAPWGDILRVALKPLGASTREPAACNKSLYTTADCVWISKA